MKPVFCVAFVCIAAVLPLVSAADPPANAPWPSLAIFTSPTIDCGTLPSTLDGVKSCIRGSYIQWAQSAAIRVVPMQWDAPLDVKTELMQKVNGVLFAGGSLDGDGGDTYSQFRDRVCEVVNLAKSWNANGDKFVIWGTCQGFQLVSSCIANDFNVIQDGFVGTDPAMLALNLTAAANSSLMFGNVDPTIRRALTGSATTLNYHHEGISPAAFADDQPLGQFYRVLSTNTDVNNREFVSTIESKLDGSFVGVQWHPEWPPTDWSDATISKSPATVNVTQWAARYLQSLLLRNNHSWSSAAALENAVVDTQAHTYQGYGVFRWWINGVPKGTGDSTNNGLIAASFIVAVVIAFLGGAAVGRFVTQRAHRRAVEGSLMNPSQVQ